MADPFAEAFAGIGADFETCMPTVNVTVKEMDPDPATATTTVANVPALKRSRRRQPFGVGDGGELGEDRCRFVVRLSRLSWVPKARDEVEDGDGVTWKVENVELIAMNQLACLNVIKKR